MNQLQLFRETITTYRKYGWRLERVLMRPSTLVQLREAPGPGSHHSDAGHASNDGDGTKGGDEQDVLRFEGVGVRETAFDAIWVARPSHERREAWELRLVAETPYALFELFEADEEEEDREDVRREMEARMREYVGA